MQEPQPMASVPPPPNPPTKAWVPRPLNPKLVAIISKGYKAPVTAAQRGQ